ncbi:MAG: histidine phosphatase family protein [Cyanobacteria bacterium J06629_19]
MKPLITRVLLVRHGRSTFNEQGRYQGSSDQSVLTAEGLKTAQSVGCYLNQRFVHRPIDIVYASPLQRVQQTAYAITQAIAPRRRPLITISSLLKEISLSHWEGLPYAQVKQQFPEQYQCWQQRPHRFQLPVHPAAVSAKGASSVATVAAVKTYFPVRSLYQSAQQFWHKTLPQHSGQTLLIVSHSATIHALISTAFGIPAVCHHSLQQSNCGISELTFRGPFTKNNSAENGSAENSSMVNSSMVNSQAVNSVHIPQAQLHQLNQTTTLGESLPKLKVNKKGVRLLLLPSEGLTAEACEQLAERMRQLPIAFCLAASLVRPLLPSLFYHCPDTLCLDVQNDSFLETWQQQLFAYRQSERPLMTGLVIAPTASIQTLLSQVLSIPTSHHTLNCLNLHPHNFSVVHYPYRHRPVVQAINIP